MNSYNCIDLDIIEKTLYKNENIDIIQDNILPKFQLKYLNINNIKYCLFGISLFDSNNVNISLFSAILTLLDKNFIIVNHPKEIQSIINFKNNILNKIVGNADITYIDIERLININIIINEKINNNFDPLKKTIILNTIENYYYPLIKYDTYQRIFHSTDDIIKHIMLLNNKPLILNDYVELDMDNEYMFTDIYDNIIELNNNMYTNEILSKLLIKDLKLFPEKLNLHIKIKSSLRKQEIIDLILNSMYKNL